MIILREKTYSNTLLNHVNFELGRSGYSDYDISSSIPEDQISLTTDLDSLEIYVPMGLEYSQYGISDFLREMSPFLRTKTTLDRNIFILTVLGHMTEAQYIKLVKHIIDQEEFCTIIDDEDE